MLETLKVFLLAVLQGVGEFLPISSSSHLAIVERLLKMDAPGVRLEVMLHVGTLLSILLFYRKKIGALLAGMALGRKPAWREAGLLLLATFPVGVAYLLIHDWLEAQFDGDLRLAGALLVVTGLALFSLRLAKGGDGSKPVTVWRALAIGFAQAVALLPGISRSGATIVCARHCGVPMKDAADFSFLLSTPLVLGAAVASLAKDGSGAGGDVGWGLLLPAMALSAAVGCFALRMLMRIIAAGRFWMFGLYCIPAGLLVFFLL